MNKGGRNKKCHFLIGSIGVLIMIISFLLSLEDAFIYVKGLLLLGGLGIYILVNLGSFYYQKRYQHCLGLHIAYPILLFVYIEYMQKGEIFSYSLIEYGFNIMLYGIIYGLLLCLVRNTRIVEVSLTILVYGIGWVNYFVVLYREAPILPSYFYSIRTALSVADGFSYEMNLHLWLGLVIGLVLIQASLLLPNYQYSFQSVTSVCLGILSLIVIGGASLVWNYVPLTHALGTGINLWDTDGFYRRHGFGLSFVVMAQNMQIKRPQGYSRQKVDEIFANVIRTPEKEGQLPDILVIMNESWCDYSIYPHAIFNQDPLKYYHQLRENTMKGQAFVSVYGGETANTEYEFLTGNPIGLLPQAALPYQEYMKGQQYSLVSLLEAQGYKSLGIHPYYKSGYSRDRAWESFGFDKSIFLDGKEGLSKNPKVSYYRDYVTDASCYQVWEEEVEKMIAKDEGPIFSFIVTMQNHGGYLGEDYDGPKIWLKDRPGQYPKAMEYLTSSYYSDIALKELLDKIDEQTRPTIVLMFGDHHPKLEEEFLREIQDPDTPDYLKYVTPYIIHANFPLEGSIPSKMSVNYLGDALLSLTNVDPSAYMDFQRQVRSQIPVVTRTGYMDEEGVWYSKEKEARFSTFNSLYFTLLYNNVFDPDKNKEYYVR